MSTSINVSCVVLARLKQLKGGCQVIRSYKRVACNVPIEPRPDGTFTVRVDNRKVKVELHGVRHEDEFVMDTAEVIELKTKHLRKGFTCVMGYNLEARKTNLN